MRKVLAALKAQGIVAGRGRERWRGGRGGGQEPFPNAETGHARRRSSERFMEWMLRDNALPGTTINELELARKFGVATTGIREFLNRFQRFGLIEKRPNAGWVFKGFTPDFALELFEIREMFELRSAQRLRDAAGELPFWDQLANATRGARGAARRDRQRFHDFSDLDSRFHRLVNSAAPNRFIDDFYDIITLIFHYHYQWNKRDERQRNEVAIREHLAYIEALLSRDVAMIKLTCGAHLTSAKETLLRSTSAQMAEIAQNAAARSAAAPRQRHRA